MRSTLMLAVLCLTACESDPVALADTTATTARFARFVALSAHVDLQSDRVELVLKNAGGPTVLHPVACNHIYVFREGRQRWPWNGCNGIPIYYPLAAGETREIPLWSWSTITHFAGPMRDTDVIVLQIVPSWGDTLRVRIDTP